jgi:hypothetical protein
MICSVGKCIIYLKNSLIIFQILIIKVMELPLERLQTAKTIKETVLELNNLVLEAESAGLTVDFTAKNRRFDNEDMVPLSVSIFQITTF